MVKAGKMDIVYFYQILVLFTPILNNYLLLPIPFLYLIGAFGFCLFLYMAVNNRLIINRNAILYAEYVVLFSFINTAILTPSFSFYSLIARTAYFLIIFVNFYIFAYQIWDYDRGFFWYKKICIFLSIIIIGQFILSYIGVKISLVPPNLTTNTADLASTNLYRINQIKEGRFSTFFLEPAHQAQYCLPCLALVLFSEIKSKKNTLFSALLLTIGILTTTSMLGILGAGIIWFAFFIFTIKEEKKRGLGTLLVIIPLLIIGLSLLWNQPVIREQFQKKIWSFNGGNIQRDTSLYVRMIYGWDCFKDLSVFQKLFGYGYSNSAPYLLSSGIGLKYTTLGLIGYMSGISKMFCELGIVGVILNWTVTFFPLLKKQSGKYDIKIIGLFVSILIIMCTADAFDAISFLLPLTFALSISLNNKNSIKRGLYNVTTC